MNSKSSKCILIIQTAFIGDTILASSFAFEVKKNFPHHDIHFLLRKGNESVIQGLDFVYKVWIWDKKKNKFSTLLGLIKQLSRFKFEYIFNLHRHFSSGLVTSLVSAKNKIGFNQNPLSIFFDHKINHLIPHREQDKPWHEVQRNLQLLKAVNPGFVISLDPKKYRPKLPQISHDFMDLEGKDYIVVAPSSVWFTKQWSEDKYKKLTRKLIDKYIVILVGAPTDYELCERVKDGQQNIENWAGKLNLLQSAHLMKNAKRVIVNDSAPLHLASAMNAPTTAIFCSTISGFGYYPLSDESVVIEIENLSCRPCGLHGHKKCPLIHFKCSEQIQIEDVMRTIN